MSEVIEARNIKLNVDASDWRDSMVKSGQLLVDSDYITKDYIDLTIKCVEENGPWNHSGIRRSCLCLRFTVSSIRWMAWKLRLLNDLPCSILYC